MRVLASLALPPTPTAFGHAAVHVARARPPLLAEDDTVQQCHLLSGEELQKVSDLLHQGPGSASYDHGFIMACDAPADDPSLTCFLKPESWAGDVGDGDWVCMRNPTHSITPDMSPEDSY